MFESSIFINQEKQLATINLASSADVKQLEGWQTIAGDNNSPKILDIVEYTLQAIGKWRLYKAKGRCPTRWADYPEWVADNPHAEVAGLFVLKTAITGNNVLGFAFVRRVWDNCLVLDLLAARPDLNKIGRKKLLVKGIGNALFNVACLVATNISASAIYAEATSSSSKFYTRLLNKEVGSLFAVNREEYTALLDRM